MSQESDILGYECRFATYAPSRHPYGQQTYDDMHVVKEYVHYKDGRRVPRIRCIPNFKQDFWVTREKFRDHKDKKEYELVDRLQKFSATRTKLADAASRALYGRPAQSPSLRQVAASPYLYGCDVTSTALIKKGYDLKFPDLIHPLSSIATLDAETDVLHGTDDIILLTVTMKDKVFTAINKAFIPEFRNPQQRINELLHEHLPDLVKERNLTLEIKVCDSPAACIQWVIGKAHELKPDFLVIWNMNFDVPLMIRQLEKEGVDPATVFSDPAVPDEFKFFKYIEGKAQKVTQGGKILPLHPAERWHTAEFPASFYIVDAMCIYKRLRTAKGNEPSYGLDAIMTKHLGQGKLKLPGYDHLEKLAWHVAMQKEQPFFYVLYNIYDCIGLELLDEKILDVCSSFPTLCGNSDFRSFTSNPRRLCDDLHYLYLERGGVMATTGAEMTDDNDEYVIGLDNWIN